MELETNLTFWLIAMFFLGLVSMALCYLFMEASDKYKDEVTQMIYFTAIIAVFCSFISSPPSCGPNGSKGVRTMFTQTWLPPFLLLLVATAVAFPLGRYMAWIMDGKYRPWRFLGWFERRLDSGPQTWKQYTASLLIFNVVLFIFGYIILSLQPWMPLNPRGLGMLAPTTIFHSVPSRS